MGEYSVDILQEAFGTFNANKNDTSKLDEK